MEDDLTQDEREALVACARHLVMADGQVSNSELFDMILIEGQLGPDAWEAALQATHSIHTDRKQVLRLAARVQRSGVQRRLLSVLERMADGDGVHHEEVAFLSELRALWS